MNSFQFIPLKHPPLLPFFVLASTNFLVFFFPPFCFHCFHSKLVFVFYFLFSKLCWAFFVPWNICGELYQKSLQHQVPIPLHAKRKNVLIRSHQLTQLLNAKVENQKIQLHQVMTQDEDEKCPNRVPATIFLRVLSHTHTSKN